MMQQQKQQGGERTKGTKQSLTLEGVLAVFHLLSGSVLLMYILWISSKLHFIPLPPSQPWYEFMGIPLMGIIALFNTLVGGLLLLRQRRIAMGLQWITVVATLCLAVLCFVTNRERLPQRQEILLWIAAYFCQFLWALWFAWFIKKQESET